MYHSFDIIGDIAVVKVPHELDKFENEIGEAVHEIHHHLKAVFREVGEPREEVERTRKLKLIWRGPVQLVSDGSSGDNISFGRTIYKEFGCRFAVDVERVFFSPRLSNERMRIARQVTTGETIINMFGGVGVYAIVIAKVCPDVGKVYTVDVNPVAYELAKENVIMNKCSGKVIPLLGDVREFCEGDLKGTCDRAIMVLPKSAKLFLDAAVAALREGGERTINFYAEVSGDNIKREIDALIREAENNLRDYGAERTEVETWRIAGKAGPKRYHVAIDLRIARKI
jgi:tRNA (guanine37-N1)-methyltransferase